VIDILKDEKSELRMNPDRIFKSRHSDLLYNTLYLFKIMVDTCMYKTVIEWPQMLSNKEKLLNLYGIVFETIAEIHKELYVKMRSGNLKQLGDITEDLWSQIYEAEIDENELAEPFEQYNVFEDVQRVYSTDVVRNKLARPK
jgi:hypothetical protein